MNMYNNICFGGGEIKEKNIQKNKGKISEY